MAATWVWKPRIIQAAILVLVLVIVVFLWNRPEHITTISSYFPSTNVKCSEQTSDQDDRAIELNCAVESILCGANLAAYVQKSSDINALKKTFHRQMTTIDFECPVEKRFGKEGDGGYFVCMGQAIRPKNNSCLVYSFGVSKDWSFDEAMGKYGCEVHSFDPSIGLKDHLHAPNHSFHNLGLWGSDFKNKDGWALEKLSTIRKRLGHEQRVIDVLKVDVEGAEWPFLRDMIFTDRKSLKMVRQLFIELHTPRFQPHPVSADDFAEINMYTRRLRDDFGFMLYKNVQRNYCCGRFSDLMPTGVAEKCCHEVFYFNSRLVQS